MPTTPSQSNKPVAAKRKPKKRGSRKGFTTGACSAAAARAATLGLINGQVPDKIESQLPNGQLVSFNVTEGVVQNAAAHAVVIKDAGDDPDVTDKAQLTADVKLLPEHPGEVFILGGEGVGVVTMGGLGLEVNGPAINPKPRKNIEDNVRQVAASILDEQGIEVTISVPGGEVIAKRTLNSRLGILGGISILGTTGIVHPYSTAAFRDSVIQGIQVASNQGHNTVVLTTGGRTEKFVMAELSELPQLCFVQMGDFLKYAMDTSQQEGIEHVVIGGMVGKLTKMAQGETITHANRNVVNTNLLAQLAAEIGVPEDICADIRAAVTARYASERMQQLGKTQAFYHALGRKVISTIMGRYPQASFDIKVLVCDFDGNKLAEIKHND